jgi:hypothetical protein
MFRVLNLVSVFALLAAAGAVYHLKYSSTFEAQEIARLRSDIRAERDRMAILNAEWARRTSPDRIQALAENHLDMQPLDVDRMDNLSNLPAKPEQGSDALGGMIEALVDGPTITGSIPPSDKTGKGVAKPSAGTSTTPPQAARPAVPVQQAAPSRPPLPLDAMPPAGVMGQAAPGPAMPAPASQPLHTAPVTSEAPLLPPASVGRYHERSR